MLVIGVCNSVMDLPMPSLRRSGGGRGRGSCELHSGHGRLVFAGVEMDGSKDRFNCSSKRTVTNRAKMSRTRCDMSIDAQRAPDTGELGIAGQRFDAVARNACWSAAWIPLVHDHSFQESVAKQSQRAIGLRGL